MLAFPTCPQLKLSEQMKKKKKECNFWAPFCRKNPSGCRGGTSEHVMPIWSVCCSTSAVLCYWVLFLLTRGPLYTFQRCFILLHKLGAFPEGSWELAPNLFSPPPPTTGSYLLNAYYVGGIMLSTKTMIRHLQKWERYTWNQQLE